MEFLDDYFNKDTLKKYTTKSGDSIYKHDGILFEDIVSILLHEMFPEFSWKRTQISNDGSKDFWAIKDGNKYWVECKNYAVSLEFKIFSNTLIVAQLCNADEIYFFSVSPISEIVKKKICYYAEVNKKNIHFICDLVLEKALLNYKSTYEYFKKYLNNNDLPMGEDIVPTYEQFFLIMKNPFLNVLLEDYILNQQIESIKLNEIISIHIFIINNSIKNNLNFEISINSENEDIYNFEYLEDTNPSNISEIKECYSLNPYGVFTKSYNFKLSVYKEKINIPNFKITYLDNVTFDSMNMSLYCENLQKTKLIGYEYEDIKNNILSKSNLHEGVFLFWCEGKSGVGKTRILEEASCVMIKNHYKVLRFIGTKNDSSFNILREIIYVLYNITEEKLKSINSLKLKEKELPENIFDSLEILSELNNYKKNTIDFIENEKYASILFEKILGNKYAIIIDNIQYYDNAIVIFIDKLIKYCINNNRNKTVSICMSINNDYLTDNQSALKLLSLLYDLNDNDFINTYNVIMEGFKKDDFSALLFLKTLLKIKEETYDDYFNNLIEKANYNPYNIKHYVDYLSDNSISKLVNGQRIINDSSKFINAIEHIPVELKNSLKTRWNSMCENFKRNEKIEINLIKNKFIHILSCLHIFNCLSYEELLELNADNLYIEGLRNYNFIKFESYGGEYKYYFDHDLVERFFEEYLPESRYACIENIEKKKLSFFKNTYPYAFYFISLYKKTSKKDICACVEYGINKDVPYKLFFDYQKKSLNSLINLYSTQKTIEINFYYIRKICVSVRERLGSIKAYNLYKITYNYITNTVGYDYIDNNEFTNIIFDIGENFQHLGKYNEVIGLYNVFLPKYQSMYNKKKMENLLNYIAFMYNRLALAYKHFPDETSKEKCFEYINKSIKISKNLVNKQYYAEALYDKATLYYNHIKYKKTFLTLCKGSCDMVDKESIELMRLHNLQRKIRICFVEKKREHIPEIIEEGLIYIKNGKYTDYRYFFSKFFHTARSMYYLMEDINLNEAILEANMAIKDTMLYGKKDLACIYILLAKINLKMNNYLNAYEEYKKAYLNNDELNSNNKEIISNMIFDDIILNINIFKDLNFDFFNRSHYNAFIYYKLMNLDAYLLFKRNYYATSIISSDDCKEPYPCI